jgi:hypothetical protein
MARVTASPRLLIVLALAGAAIAAGCGDDSEPSSPAAPATTTSRDSGATGVTGKKGSSKSKNGKGYSSPQQVDDGKDKSASERRQARRRASRRPSGFDPAVRNKYKGTQNVVYHEARLRCLVVPVSSLARAYGVSDEDLNKLAEAYARREFPVGSQTRAAYDGCRDGLSSNRNK